MQKKSVVFQPGEGKSFWQPMPANGFVEVKVKKQVDEGGVPFECGIQSVAVNSFIREHAHPECEELILVYQGTGEALVEGETYKMQPGTVCYLTNARHKFVNTGDKELRFFWIFMPGGLSEFFAAIGHERQPNDPAPPPFPRPENIKAIEAATVFASLSAMGKQCSE